jgi:hypothetical protein
MSPAEVVIEEVEAKRGPMILRLSAEGVRQSGESANLHPRERGRAVGPMSETGTLIFGLNREMNARDPVILCMR